MRRYLTLMAIVMIALSAMARQPRKGYRGFVDISGEYRSERFEPQDYRFRTIALGLSTSHGYQINSKKLFKIRIEKML